VPTLTDPPIALREAAYVDREDMDSLDNIVIGEWMDEYLRENSMTREDLVAIREERDAEMGFITLYLPCGGVSGAGPSSQNLTDKRCTAEAFVRLEDHEQAWLGTVCSAVFSNVLQGYMWHRC